MQRRRDAVLASRRSAGSTSPAIGLPHEESRGRREDLALLRQATPGLAREAPSADLEGSRTLNANSTRELLARLKAEGLIRGDANLDLTPEGETLHRSLRDYIAGPTVRLLSQFDIDDIETTVRTLQAITKRAEEELTVAS